MGRRSRNKEILLALVNPPPPEQPVVNDEITHLIEASKLETTEGEIIVDKGDFYLLRKGDQFICMQKGVQRDTKHAIFDSLEDAQFHMDNEH